MGERHRHAHAWAIDSLVVESDAAVTWSLGTASGGAQIISPVPGIGRNYIADVDFRDPVPAALWQTAASDHHHPRQIRKV